MADVPFLSPTQVGIDGSSVGVFWTLNDPLGFLPRSTFVTQIAGCPFKSMIPGGTQSTSGPEYFAVWKLPLRQSPTSSIWQFQGWFEGTMNNMVRLLRIVNLCPAGSWPNFTPVNDFYEAVNRLAQPVSTMVVL